MSNSRYFKAIKYHAEKSTSPGAMFFQEIGSESAGPTASISASTFVDRSNCKYTDDDRRDSIQMQITANELHSSPS